MKTLLIIVAIIATVMAVVAIAMIIYTVGRLAKEEDQEQRRNEPFDI